MKLIDKSSLVNDMVALTDILKCEDDNKVSIQTVVADTVEVIDQEKSLNWLVRLRELNFSCLLVKDDLRKLHK